MVAARAEPIHTAKMTFCEPQKASLSYVTSLAQSGESWYVAMETRLVKKRLNCCRISAGAGAEKSTHLHAVPRRQLVPSCMVIVSTEPQDNSQCLIGLSRSR